jgi:Flp pilus assembly pilin Flp
MALVQQLLASIRQDEEGQGLAEYALILALIAIVAIIALIFLGGLRSSDRVGTVPPGTGPTGVDARHRSAVSSNPGTVWSS